MFSRFPNLNRSVHLSARVCFRNPKRGGYQIEDELGEFLTHSKNVENSPFRIKDDRYRFTPFRDLINSRRDEAKRSLFVQVRSEESADDLAKYCSTNFGTVKSLHFHQNKNCDAFTNFYIVEFEDASCVENAVLSHSRHNSAGSSIPVYSPFLWFAGKNENVGSDMKQSESTVPVFLPPKTVDSDEGLIEHLSQFSTIELCLRGIFAKAEVLPFGSSVNSFGKKNSDLDMAVVFDGSNNNSNKSQYDGSRLMFQAKGSNYGGQRLQGQRYCDQISNILQHFLPGCQEVQNILHARVPIVKYQQQLLGLECDLSVTSLSGFYMSELLYLYGELDRRVRPLVFTVRRWAKDQGLIQDLRPTPSFTNFSITLLVLFFLQKKYNILPPLRDLQRLAGADDDVVCDDGVRCNYLRDVTGLQPSLNSRFHDTELSLAQMLSDFFQFYSHEFDFGRDAVCIISGDIQPKRFANQNSKISARNVSYFLDITNPLEPDLNVSANVQDHAVRKFKTKCEETLTKLYKMQESGSSLTTLPKLMFIFSPEIVKNLNVKVRDLGNWSTPLNSQTHTSTILASGVQPSQISHIDDREKGKFHDDRRRQEFLKKKYLRAPRVKNFFGQKFNDNAQK